MKNEASQDALEFLSSQNRQVIAIFRQNFDKIQALKKNLQITEQITTNFFFPFFMNF